jgi:hypothetical protein
MRTLKTFFSSLLLLLVTFQASSLYAIDDKRLPVYQDVITNISLDYDGAFLTGTIILNNCQILRIVDYKVRDDNVMKKWRAGDIVILKAEIKDDVLFLLIKRPCDEVEAYTVFDGIHSPKNGLRIVEINNGGKFVKLSDHSVWEFSWFNQLSTRKWKVGEMVLVQKRYNNAYDFINLEAPVQKNAASATASFFALIKA